VSYVVLYLKARINKDGSLDVDGPMLGPETDTREEADEAAKKIVTTFSRVAIMPRIYELEDWQAVEELIVEVEPHFDRMKTSLWESKQIADKPIFRRRKKKKK
jgi:hypothetical protein